MLLKQWHSPLETTAVWVKFVDTTDPAQKAMSNEKVALRWSRRLLSDFLQIGQVLSGVQNLLPFSGGPDFVYSSERELWTDNKVWRNSSMNTLRNLKLILILINFNNITYC